MTTSAATASDPREINLVEMWLKRDPSRWIAGAIAGCLAAVIAFAIAGILASSTGLEFLFPVKLVATILFGRQASDLGSTAGVMLGGVVLIGFVAAVLGAVYAHFVFTNKAPGLLAMGLVWGIFSWIFIWNLFMQSFRTISASSYRVSSSAAIVICLVFGLCLASVSFIHRAMGGGTR